MSLLYNTILDMLKPSPVTTAQKFITSVSTAGQQCPDVDLLALHVVGEEMVAFTTLNPLGRAATL